MKIENMKLFVQAVVSIENFSFSKRLLDDYFAGAGYEIVYVTNTSRVYRARLIAKRCGLSTETLAASTIRAKEINFNLKEYCSLLHF